MGNVRESAQERRYATMVGWAFAEQAAEQAQATIEASYELRDKSRELRIRLRERMAVLREQTRAICTR